MNILFIVEVKIIVVFIKWSYRSPQPLPPYRAHTHVQLVLHIERAVVIIFSTCNPISFEDMSFWYPFLEAMTYHVPLEYRCPVKMSNQIRHVYFTWPRCAHFPTP